MTITPNTGDLSSPTTREIIKFHKNADTDGSNKAIHHTLGPGPNQAAAGNHTHDGGSSAQIDNTNMPAPPDVPWITLPLSGGWTDYLTNFQTCQYRKVNDVVELRGMMKHATTTTTGTFVTMPADCRVVGAGNTGLQFIAMASGGWVDIRALNDGTIRIQSYQTGANGGSVSLSQIRYSTL